MDIIDEIKNGESKILEFKETLPLNSSIAKTAISFSNTAGGKLVIGVNDDREIIGIEEDIFDLQDKISSIIYDNCYPNIIPEIYTKNINGKIILVIKIYKGNLLPYYKKSEGKNNGVYIRIGATNRKASFENIQELERQGRNIYFDEEINYNYELKDIDLKPLKKRFEKIDKELTNDKLLSLKLIKEENGNLYPTNGLLILLGILENVISKCSKFKGINMNTFLDKKEYAGDLFNQLENIESFIKNHINLKGEIKGLQRVDTYEIPEVAIRESVVNALVHRDYSNLGRDIKIGIYDDRLEIVSPGGLPNTLTNEDIFSGKSEIRNRVVARIFKELSYIEQWGSGINRIKLSCLEQGLKEPFIKESGDFVGVRFFRENKEQISNSIGKVSESIGEVSEQEKNILDFITENGKIVSKKVEELLEVKEARARRILKEMFEKRYIERKGQGRSTYYVLSK